MNANRDSLYVVFCMNSYSDPKNAMSHHPYIQKQKKKERKKERKKEGNPSKVIQVAN